MITNFKPQTDYKNNKYSLNGSFNSNTKNKQIFCKKFLLFMILIKYKNYFYKKINFFIKKYKKKVYTILRSPYRHKLARHQILLNRYFINFSILFNIKSPFTFNKNNDLVNFLNFLKKFKKSFESNIIYINNSSFNITIKHKNNFKKLNFFKK